MSINIGHLVAETRDGLRRTRLSFVFSVLTVAFLLSVLGSLFLVSHNLDRLLSSLKIKFEIEVFIANTMDDEAISLLGARIKNHEAVKSLEFFSKEAAARHFQQQFGQQLFDILEENPLPSSFHVKLEPTYQNSSAIRSVATDLDALRGVDDVVYHSEALDVLSRYASLAQGINIAMVIFVFLGSLLVMTNTIRLTIVARRSIIETMKWVGASYGFIRSPYIFQGVLQGGIGGGVASAVLLVVIQGINYYIPQLITTPSFFFALFPILGTLIGGLASAIAIRRFLKV